MLFTPANTTASTTAKKDEAPIGPTSSSNGAHRSFCDLLEEEDVAAVAEDASATTAGPTITGSPNGVANKTAGGTGERTPGKTAAASRFFEGAAASVRRGLVGRNALFRTPYGMKPLVYSDWTATGRAVDSIEAFMADQVAPLFGNTHTTTSVTGAQTTCFRHESRQIIAQAVNAKVTGRAAEDVVLFTGTGATAAVAKLVSALGLTGPLPPGLGPDDRPVVFVGPFEHHSNLLPWRESCAEVVTIGENSSTGGLHLEELERQLRRFAGRKLKIGSFSAASNVTGGLEDVDRVTAALHRAGALALWDYATAAPYVHVDMNPAPSSGADDQALVAKDAIFFSGHKFVGGPGTPGVLVVKKRLLCNAVPGTVGGGTVFFVTKNDHRYLSNKEEREEGGTPDILGSVRLGLAVQMKEHLGRQGLMEREEALAELGLRTLRAHPRVVVLGDTGRKRLPIFSFLIRTDGGRFLHYNFVCSLLNDLFGVQSRGGCQCAGPYSQLLLGMTLQDTRAVEAELLRKHELLRPGFSRLSLSYVNSDDEAKYILDAVAFVADHGAAFLSSYRLNYKTGEWKHKTRFTRFPERRWLGHCGYGFPPKVKVKATNASAGTGATPGGSAPANGNAPAATSPAAVASSPLPAAAPEGTGGSEERNDDGEGGGAGAKEEGVLLEGVLEEAARHLEAAEAGIGEARWQGSGDVLSPEGEALRWFLYPWEGGSGVTHSKDQDSSSPSSSGAAGSGGGNESACCIIKPKVYGGIEIPGDGRLAASAGAAVAAANAADAETTTAPADGSASRNGGDGVMAPAVAGVPTASGAADVATDETRGERLVGAALVGGGDVVSVAAAATATGRVGTPPPPPLSPAGRSHGEQDAGSSAPRPPASSKDAPQTAARKEPDDSHKYPLRQAISGDGESGGFVLAAETPPFLASSSASNGSGAGSGTSAVALNGGGNSGAGAGGASATANGDASNNGSSSSNSKLKGYDGHMSALGKLGAGSAESRLFPKPGKKLLKAVGQAVQAWKMIEEGDRLCLGLSGGKDSMTLLHVLLDLQKRAPITFEVACATVDPQTASFDPSPLVPYLERLGVKLHYLSSPIIEQAKTSMKGDSLCAFCARMKRGLLYACCREEGYNKLVLAQHLDDLAESFIMSALHNGQVRTMKANYKIEAGDVRVIRPLCYARESLTKDFARANRLPVVNENCPACFEEPKERHRVKKMLAKEESLFPTMYANLRKALVPLMDDDAYTSMNKTSAEVAARQVERHSRPPTRRRGQAPVQQENPAAATPETAPPAAVLPGGNGGGSTTPGGGEGQQQPGSSSASSGLAGFSDEALELELRRRRGGRNGGVGAGAGGACGQDGGVCVPCFEIA